MSVSVAHLGPGMMSDLKSAMRIKTDIGLLMGTEPTSRDVRCAVAIEVKRTWRGHLAATRSEGNRMEFADQCGSLHGRIIPPLARFPH